MTLVPGVDDICLLHVWRGIETNGMQVEEDFLVKHSQKNTLFFAAIEYL